MITRTWHHTLCMHACMYVCGFRDRDRSGSGSNEVDDHDHDATVGSLVIGDIQPIQPPSILQQRVMRENKQLSKVARVRARQASKQNAFRRALELDAMKRGQDLGAVGGPMDMRPMHHPSVAAGVYGLGRGKSRPSSVEAVRGSRPSSVEMIDNNNNNNVNNNINVNANTHVNSNAKEQQKELKEHREISFSSRRAISNGNFFHEGGSSSVVMDLHRHSVVVQDDTSILMSVRRSHREKELSIRVSKNSTYEADKIPVFAREGTIEE